LGTEALVLENIDALYGESHVLHGVSFALGEGRVLALLGRNGAGKTTCMNSVIGFLPPRSGSVRLFGKPVERLSPEAISRRGIALVPQGRRVFPRLTVRENLIVAFQKRSVWTLDKVFDLFPRLKERHGQDAGSLSGGEQQMLAIGRALMGNPTLLLMDEPLEGLAPIIVEALLRSLERLIVDEHLAVILVEQHAKLALQVTREAIVMSRGRFTHHGPSQALLADPERLASLVVAQ
jgi:branched-chain amino acid transport system ATP-binding protein